MTAYGMLLGDIEQDNCKKLELKVHGSKNNNKLYISYCIITLIADKPAPVE